MQQLDISQAQSFLLTGQCSIRSRQANRRKLSRSCYPSTSGIEVFHENCGVLIDEGVTRTLYDTNRKQSSTISHCERDEKDIKGLLPMWRTTFPLAGTSIPLAGTGTLVGD